MDQSSVCPPKTRSDLEWDRVLAALAERAQSDLGKRAAESLAFAEDRAAALLALEEVREAVELEIGGEPVSVGALPDAEPAVERARIGSALGSEELRAVLGVLTAARSLRAFLKSRRERAPRLAEACATDPALDDLERELATSFEPDGSLSDRASPELASLRGERRTVRDRLVRKLEELIAKHADLLQDGYYTERDGRYVLPLRADAHERFPGIVHSASGSGATVFVEPRALVDQGNRLKMLDAQIERVERAILARLSAQVAEGADAIAEALRALAHADLRGAAARLARDLRLTFPEIAPETEPFAIALRNARHPLLVLDGTDVVPSDLEARAGEAIVVSGPNAGGKTIALKTLGLAALMLRAGLPVPARDGSRLSVLEAVLTDVGDDQNLHKNLSTFSAHVRNLAAILDETRPGALVLLDEVCGGTDPREGEALAAAILDSLAARGGAIACTTHYEGLKTLALQDPRFKNASVGFDMATMSPTFRLAIGVPGPSSALAVARRFGIPDLLVERASRFLSRETVAFEEMVQKLAAERREVEELRQKALREAEELREKHEAADAELSRLRAKERTAATEQGQELLSALRRARDDLRQAQAKLRAPRPGEDDVRAAAKLIDAVAQKAALGGELSVASEPDAPARAPVAAGAIKVGARVYVPKLRAEADVIEVLASGQIRVAARALTLTTRVEDVREAGAGADASAKASKGGKAGGPAAGRASSFAAGAGRHAQGSAQAAGARKGSGVILDAAADPDVPIQTSENTVDLRGLRAHEATAMAEQFLDRMMGSGRRVAFLIHGHGTGALRDAVRETMRGNPYVARSRAGEQREGGDGVTVVWLR
jgi:DNA mismatch repair protein MutS2